MSPMFASENDEWGAVSLYSTSSEVIEFPYWIAQILENLESDQNESSDIIYPTPSEAPSAWFLIIILSDLNLPLVPNYKLDDPFTR